MAMAVSLLHIFDLASVHSFYFKSTKPNFKSTMPIYNRMEKWRCLLIAADYRNSHSLKKYQKLERPKLSDKSAHRVVSGMIVSFLPRGKNLATHCQPVKILNIPLFYE